MTSILDTGVSDRLVTRVPGLDTILCGGLSCGGIFMVSGRPGAGKTILANQIAFNHTSVGGRTAYVTLLTESHARLLMGLARLDFFDSERLGNSIWYLSGYPAFAARDYEGLLRFLTQAMRERQASLLVLDGLVPHETDGALDLPVRKFIHELQLLGEILGCTTLLLTGERDESAGYAERTMADGLIDLRTTHVGMRTVREIEIVKLRGSDAILGTHFFVIDSHGITVHPRVESVFGKRPPVIDDTELLPFGIAGLDDMLAGGAERGSATMICGGAATGKTIIGLNFLAQGATRNEPGLYVGFSEGTARIVRKAERISLPFGRGVEQGLLHVKWLPALEQAIDSLGYRLIEEVGARDVVRLFIDGLDALEHSILHPERVATFFTALTNELRARRVTTLLTQRAIPRDGWSCNAPGPLATVVNNMITLRLVQRHAERPRLIAVTKTGEGGHDTSVRAFTIGDDGVRVDSSSAGAEVLLTDDNAKRRRK